MTPTQCQALADYNQWMNERIYAICGELDEATRRADKGAFFGSIHGQLNHILFADRMWMGRFLGERLVSGRIGDILWEDWQEMREAREATDALIRDWARGLSQAALDGAVSWTSGQDGQRRAMPLWLLATHMFNHQTHHRGQLTTVLTQMGIDYGVTDLPWMPGAKAYAAADGPDAARG